MVRVKHRYLICQVMLEPTGKQSDFSAKDILIAIKDRLQLLFGDIGSGTIGSHLIIKFFDAQSCIFVIRTMRDSVNDAWFALSCTNEIKKQACTIRCLNMCGCERTCFGDLKRLLEVYVRNANSCSRPNSTSGQMNEEEISRKILEYT